MTTMPKWAPSRDKTLQEHVNWWAGKGYRIVTQTETTAQLVRPKQFSLVWALLWFLVFGVGLLVYVFYYVAKRDQQVYLYVEDGEVLTKK